MKLGNRKYETPGGGGMNIPAHTPKLKTRRWVGGWGFKIPSALRADGFCPHIVPQNPSPISTQLRGLQLLRVLHRFNDRRGQFLRSCFLNFPLGPGRAVRGGGAGWWCGHMGRTPDCYTEIQVSVRVAMSRGANADRLGVGGQESV